uniref:IWS1-like protein n=1 Tax=Caenorhabditis japonica TaxID=281687 RepID=A0A8R1HYJ9_CAEJA
MSDDEEVSRGGSPAAPVSPTVSRSPSPHSEGNNAPESPVGDAEDIYKDDAEAPAGPVSSAPASPVGSGHNSPVGSRSPSPIKTKSKIAIDSDSDGEEAPSKRILLDSDESDTEQRQKRATVFGSDDDSDQEGSSKKTAKELFGDDSDDDDDGPKKRDDLNELVEGHRDEDGERDGGKIHSDSDGEGPQDRYGRTFEWDFDKMMAEKKAERKRKTRRGGKDGGIDIINDDDGLVMRLTERMKAAAKSDRNANVERKPAFQKIKMLPEVKAMLLKAGIVDALIENGFMSALSEWLAPLPDKCLPALDIRITILKLLHVPRFWKLDRSTLKQSGLGKAVMMLYKHPNETKDNKAIANKLIGEWARPIYHLDADYSTISRQEREERDYSRMPSQRKQKLAYRSRDDDDERESRESKRPKLRESDNLDSTKSGELKPGDKGYINRARVPKPSTRDYVVRPEWKVTGEFKGEKKATGSNRYEQTFRDFQERTKKSKANRLVKVSLEGRNMGI